MIEHKPYEADSPHTQWDSLYTGEAGDYEEPDADILEAVADLDVGEALDVGCGAGGLCIELDKRGFEGFEVLKAKIVDSPAHAHAHGGPKQQRELWKALIFMARRPTA